MVFIGFILAAAVTVFTAIKLSEYADVLSEKTAMGGMIVGTVLLAGATSLPEVTTSFSAAVIGNVDIAVGNMLGSNVFNLFILAGFDLYFRRKQIYHKASSNHKYTAYLGLFLMLLVSLALLLQIDYTILGIGVDALLILIIYIAGMVVISKMPAPPSSDDDESSEPVAKKRSMTVKQAIIGFIIASVFILAAGTMLSITGDQIAVITGLGSSFVGSFLIAATTSLPEAVSVFAALRIKNANLAVGAILGSNVFNMTILAISDAVYQEGSILADVSMSNIYTALGGSILGAITIWAFLRKRTSSVWVYSIPSILTVVGYFVITYLIYVGS
ncbi:sodium:calcium antiporter [Virgibacillus sp. NKC19-16]|uniref:sodium:calcium antiporter n=1 Tax=Virgibacillus salidurans TaxID=2831673 RepID=UPI001F304CA0|nr:sodium:calcium antiporter [Virgibacillus sp. NKC19-16]UJL46080.1 sodium:calcium antiporter [Virgibacillus sp. NKC19-16]